MYSGPSFGADTSTIYGNWGYSRYTPIDDREERDREYWRQFQSEQKIKRQWALILKRKAARKSSTKASRKARRLHRGK